MRPEKKKPTPPPRPLGDHERDRLEALLDALPAPLEPLDLSALDGFLVGVLLQPQRVPEARWLAHVHDLDARAAPPGVVLAPLHALVRQRHAELDAAIAARRWFDPWVFELDPEPGQAQSAPTEAVLPWVAGFAAAQDLFPQLMAQASGDALEPLAVLYAHFDASDLEDADELLALIETLEPPATLAEAVEDLVRCTLLLADVTRPLHN
jgi:uncharacterized protein